LSTSLVELFGELVHAGVDRPRVAREIAKLFGAREFFIFLRDGATGAYLPAVGFPQTLPRGLAWQRFVAEAVASREHRGVLPFPNADQNADALGLGDASGFAVVLLGDGTHVPRIDDLRGVLPLVAFGLRQERLAGLRQVEAGVARESAANAQRLAETVDAVRRQLDRHFEFTRAITDSLGEAVFTMDTEGLITFVNSVAERVFGWKAAELIGKRAIPTICGVDSGPNDASDGPWREVIFGGVIRRIDRTTFKRNGGMFPARYTAAPIRAASEVRGVVVVFEDLTEQDRNEQRLRETQKLESIGLLAGGIAHDFNNLLVGILGNTSLVLDELAADHPWRELLQGVMSAGERAADLTRQLLAYAGKGRFVVSNVDLSDVAAETINIVQASISKRVRVEATLGNQLPAVEGDRTQLQQLLMNLIINAAEAIGDEEGMVRVMTTPSTIDQDQARRFTRPSQLKAGAYVCVEVQDSGSGMDEETQARIFEPFFTTKFFGRGLGLAATLGIVRGHGGAIHVSSAPGQGSTFRILLPAKVQAHPEPPAENAVAKDQSGATVLVIDDEGIVRLTTRTTLARAGFTVILSDNGANGLQRLEADPRGVDLLLLDFAMPVMGGPETFRRVHDIRPDLPVIVMSGYSDSEVARHFGAPSPSAFLQKPFTAAQLLHKMHTILGAARRAAQNGGRDA
jgi:PAS domain S-box-containing protein